MIRIFFSSFLLFWSFSCWSQHNISGPALLYEDTTFTSCFLDEFEHNMRQMYQQYASLDEYEKIKAQLGYEPGHVPNFTSKQYCQRLMKMNEFSEFPFDCHPSVISAIEDFGTRRRSTIKIALGRSKLYFDLFESMLDRHELPLELKYLPVVESMLLPKARSHAGALGLWQFMYGTGKMFGLVENSFIDERMDPIKATEAACLYLKKLYGIYNDWNLALAAYNAGPGNVNKAIRRAEGKTTYWEVRPFLPKETQNYVPRFMAIAYLMEHHVVHNIVPAEHSFKYYDVDTVCLSKGVQMQRIEALIALPVAEIQMLNPVYKGSYIPKTEPHQCITLPIEKIALFIEYEQDIYKSDNVFLNGSEALNDSIDIPAQEDLHIRYHKVEKGETLATIARKYGTTKAKIMTWNGLQYEKLKIGQTLKIEQMVVPVANPTTQTTENGNVATNDSLATQASLANAEPVTIRHTVKSGETLYAIAQYYKVAVDQVVKWNTLSSSNVYVGQVLLIYSGDPTIITPSNNVNTRPTNPATPVKKYHSVRSGETLSAIAKKYGTTVAAIQKLNPKLNPNRLQVGQKIRVK